MLATAFVFVVVLDLLASTVDSTALTCKVDDGEPWSYHGRYNGPAAWGETHPKCYGHEQSPVAIDTDHVVSDAKLQKLMLNNYKTPIDRATVVNNGHSVQVTFLDGVARTIQVKGSIFTLQQLHFHWGSRYSQGSEHSLNGVHYILEAHFVHTDSNNNIAVVGVFFQNAEEDNKAFKPISDLLPDLLFKGSSAGLKSKLDLNGLLPANPASFYRYKGSLTTPGCDENVTWSVLQGIQRIGKSQMHKLQKLYSAKNTEEYSGCKITDNFRPLQPLNNRVVYKSL